METQALMKFALCLIVLIITAGLFSFAVHLSVTKFEELRTKILLLEARLLAIETAAKDFIKTKQL